MSTNYTIACHTCKKKVDLSFRAYGRDFIAAVAGSMLMYSHITHNMQIVHDITGWDEEYDKLEAAVQSYADFTNEEIKDFIDGAS
ncbi:hypothetical protein BPS13_0152 [Bacillus phage BPS13]|uniref:Uncharacterized protein n=1 Tax=Bacillus phage BPS13 TaxID=1136731 RepID=J9PUH9_9CAUD|nr:hypothetical protein BPS13_0152 [Bacillus phage BPS13]AEZ50331.1 hypothetical protein BPS13_0152 [Bacillus phage BPS13]